MASRPFGLSAAGGQGSWRRDFRRRESDAQPLDGGRLCLHHSEKSSQPSDRLLPLSHVEDYAKAIEALDEIPGIAPRSAEVILAEIGLDMGRFPSAAHLCSWAGICPGNHKSAGKRYHGRTRKGNKTLKSILTQCAKAARNVKTSYFSAQYHRIAARGRKTGRRSPWPIPY